MGIEKCSGTKVSIMMADLSDDVEDLKRYNNLIDQKNLDAVLGSRFSKGSRVIDYPFSKINIKQNF